MAREITGPMRESTIAWKANGHVGKCLYKHLCLYHRLRHLSTLIKEAILTMTVCQSRDS